MAAWFRRNSAVSILDQHNLGRTPFEATHDDRLESKLQNNTGQRVKRRRPSSRVPSILAQRARPSSSVSYAVCYIRACLLAAAPHQSVLGLFDEEGLSVLAQLHVQTDRLPVDLDVHLQQENRLTHFYILK